MKKALLFLGILLSTLIVNAEDNVLQTIEIVPVKDTYNIVLTTDRKVDVKKTVQAPNKITLEMKGIRASKTLNTIYNNVSNVDTVMVEPAGNGISLFFQAENAQGASVSFDSIAPIMPVKTEETPKKVTLNSPIESYAPIYREEAGNQKTSELFNKLTQKTASLSEDVQENVSDSANKIFSFGLIGLLAFSVIKLFKRKEPEMKIGLTQSLNEREIDMYGGSQPVPQTYVNTEKPFTTVNYGINAYKKENQNPYEQEVPMTIHNPRLQQYVSPVARAQAQAQMQAQSAQNVLNAVHQQRQQTMTAPVQQPVRKTGVSTQSNPNIDNLKFLESMTAIYEKSGRHDLAQGLKANLSKNNIKA